MDSLTEGHQMICSRCNRPTPGFESSPGAISSVCIPGTGCMEEPPTTVEEEAARPRKSKK